MSNLRQAAQQALEALEGIHRVGEYPRLQPAVTALRAALAEEALQRLTSVSQEIETALAEQCQHGVTDGNCKECYVAEQEQQPVEWLTGCPECGMDGGCDCPSGTWNPPEQELVIDCPRCGHCCPQRKPLTDEEVNECGICGYVGKDKDKTGQCPKCRWDELRPLTGKAHQKPLTDDQIYEMYNEPRSDAEMLEFARAIEAAHGIKVEA